MADDFTLTARWVFPVIAPPLERGVVTVRNDRIIAVEPHRAHKADIDLGDVAIVPGFVNSHTHLDLTGARGLTPPTPDFVGWLQQVIAYRRERTAEQVAADVQTGIAESLRFGTTLVGDIAVEGATWDALAAAPIRAVVYRELIGLSEERAAAAWEGFDWWLKAAEETATCRAGVSPHALYSVAESLYMRATFAGVPLAIHLAETRAEMDLLATHSGPFVPFLKNLGAWAPDRMMSNVERAIGNNTIAVPCLIVHGTFLPATAPIFSHGTIVYCPRTHAAFGHPPHPFREFLRRGVRVALGTDSLASNPDLSVLGEARFLRTRYADLRGGVLLRLATLSGAEACDWADDVGSLDSGKSADFAVVALPSHHAADPHDLLFDSDLPVVATWFRGQEVFRLTEAHR
jgi:cytosine/adenosine deaminase-related metal-dependent hydrolase